MTLFPTFRTWIFKQIILLHWESRNSTVPVCKWRLINANVWSECHRYSARLFGTTNKFQDTSLLLMDFNPILHLGLALCSSNFIGYFCFKGQNCSFFLGQLALIRCNCICALCLEWNSTLNVMPTNFFLRWFYVTWQWWWICLWILNYYFPSLFLEMKIYDVDTQKLREHI